MTRLRSSLAMVDHAAKEQTGRFYDKLPPIPPSKEELHVAFFDGAIRSLQNRDLTDFERGMLAAYQSGRKQALTLTKGEA